MNNQAAGTARWTRALGLLASLLIVASSTPAAAQSIRVVANGQQIDFQGVPPIQVGGRVMVPLRGVFEALGARVDFDGRRGTVHAVRGDTQMQLKLASADAYVNGQHRRLDVPAQVRFNRTFVPLRFVSEAMGAQVFWNEIERIVLITGGQGNPGIPGTVTPPGTTPVTPGQPAAGTPEIKLVTHSARKPLKVGDRLVVEVRGSPAMQASVEISPKANMRLAEVAGQPGLYSGTYTVRDGDDVVEKPVTATLVGGGRAHIVQSQDALTIDTDAPKVALPIYPEQDKVIKVPQPNIFFHVDEAGTGVARALWRFTTGNNQAFVVTPTVAVAAAGKYVLSAVPPQALSGRTTVRFEVTDGAGNTLTNGWSFVVEKPR